MDNQSLSEQVNILYPQGLTGIYHIDSPNVVYALELANTSLLNQEIIQEEEYTKYMAEHLCKLIEPFFHLGGTNLILHFPLPHVSQKIKNDYLIAIELKSYCSEKMKNFYESNAITPYFPYLENWLNADFDSPIKKAAKILLEFQKNWRSPTTSRKIILEISSVPRYAMLQAFLKINIEQRQSINKQLAEFNEWSDKEKFLHKSFMKLIYGVEFSSPRFYLRSTLDNSLKFQSPLPIAFLADTTIKLFYTPYPLFFMSHDTQKAIFENLIIKKPTSTKTDYSGMYNRHYLEEAYEKIQKLNNEPACILGIKKSIE